MINNDTKIIVFEENYNDIIVEILKNNNLQESWDNYFEKIDKGKEPWSDIIYQSTKNLVAGNFTESEFISEIQKQLKTTEQTAKNILKEVKEKVLPLARIISKDEIEEETDVEMPIKPLQKPIGVSEILFQTKKLTPLNSISSTPKTPRDTKKPINKKIKKTEIKQDALQHQRKQNDKYKEPIE